MLAEATTAAQSTRSQVLAALKQASAETGSDFSYLLGTALRESSLKPQAKSGSSSAAGLFQFVSQTWLSMIKQYGAKYGLGSYADAIHKGADGRYRADNAADRRAILALRNNPKVSALMAGEYANQTKTQLESRLGRGVCGGELYAAHFLGAGAACRLIELNDSNPKTEAATCFPAAAQANRGVFYHRNGSPKTVREVYDWALRQPRVPAKVLAQAETATPLSQPMPAAAPLSFASDLFAQPVANGAEDWSTTSLFTGATPQIGPLMQSMAVPQTPLMLTPGVVDLLASLGSDKHAQDAENRQAA